MVLEKKRKTYKNPQIVEAVIEVRFVNPIDNAKVQSALGSQYNCRREDLVSFTAQPGPEGVAVARKNIGEFRVHFAIRKHITAFVYPNRVSFHWQGKYPGWNVFQPAFKEFWEKLLKVIPAITSSRIGVRFINIVNEKTSDQEVGYWLKPAVNYPEGLLSSKGGYFYSIRRPLKSEQYIQLFIAEGETKNGEHRPLILDIDIQSDKAAQQIFSQEELVAVIDELHEEVVHIFEGSITRNYFDLLNQEEA